MQGDTRRNGTHQHHKKSPGRDLIRGLTDLRDAMQAGDNLPARFTMRTVELHLEPREYTPEEVRAIRDSLKASQGVFAKLLGISIKTLQAWEQGHNLPSPMARRLLDTIERDPAPWERILRESASSIA